MLLEPTLMGDFLLTSLLSGQSGGGSWREMRAKSTRASRASNHPERYELLLPLFQGKSSKVSIGEPLTMRSNYFESTSPSVNIYTVMYSEQNYWDFVFCNYEHSKYLLLVSVTNLAWFPRESASEADLEEILSSFLTIIKLSHNLLLLLFLTVLSLEKLQAIYLGAKVAYFE